MSASQSTNQAKPSNLPEFSMPLKLQQGQVWKAGAEHIRIVRLNRLEVEYKSQLDLASPDGTHHRATKKEFCRLIKAATLLPTKSSRG
jgi:hypothetical protein